MWQSSADVHGPTGPGLFHVPHDPTELGRAYTYYINLIGAHLKHILSLNKILLSGAGHFRITQNSPAALVTPGDFPGLLGITGDSRGNPGAPGDAADCPGLPSNPLSLVSAGDYRGMHSTPRQQRQESRPVLGTPRDLPGLPGQHRFKMSREGLTPGRNSLPGAIHSRKRMTPGSDRFLEAIDSWERFILMSE